jgi:hypothetical protein
MAVDIYAWEILSNHLHIVIGIRPDIVQSWTDREVADRYIRMCPSLWRRRLRGIPLDAPPTEEEIGAILADPGRINVLRSRMSNLSWFMAKLKEPIARRANREDGCTGHFWEGRYRCFAALDTPAILIASTYVDLNAVRAGMVERPEDTRHGSIAERVMLLESRPRRTSIPLQPIPGLSDVAYLQHVDRWARTLAPGKKSMPRSVPPILERLGLTAKSLARVIKEGWETCAGTALGTAESLREEAKRRGGAWVCTPIHGPAG